MIDKLLKVSSFLLLFLGYILLNIGIDDYFKGFEYLLIISIVFIALSIFIIIRKKLYKYAIAYIIILILYTFLHTFISINNDYKYNFLDNLDSYYMENDYYTELELESCLEELNCDYDKALDRKIQNIELLLENPEGLESISYLNYKLSNLLKNKNILEVKNLSYKFEIDLDLDSYLKNSLKNSYINTLDSVDLDNFSLLFSGNQFKKYSQEYYYRVYDSMKKGKYTNLKEYDNDDLYLFFVNRKYKYNIYLEDYDVIEDYIEEIKRTYSLVTEINEKQ